MENASVLITRLTLLVHSLVYNWTEVVIPTEHERRMQ